MNAVENTSQTRLLTPDELAFCIKVFREARQWSQEQLADISRLNVRTIQRVEQGQPASFDTRRALASAFGFEDIDALNKPFIIPPQEEIKAAQDKFDREHVTLSAIPLTTGKQLAKLVEICKMDISAPAFELTQEADETFARLVDYFRDYRDIADEYTEIDKFVVYGEMQDYIDTLNKLGISLRYAERRIQLRFGTGANTTVMPANVLYVTCFPLGKESAQFAALKSCQFSL